MEMVQIFVLLYKWNIKAQRDEVTCLRLKYIYFKEAKEKGTKKKRQETSLNERLKWRLSHFCVL